MTIMSRYSERNNPVLDRDQEPVLIRCEYDGKEYNQCDMLYDKYHNGTGAWIYKGNIEAFSKRELPLHEQESYIQIIKRENEISKNHK